ncbi:[protein-PII] uridylyltransferase [Enterovirga sp.]|uniref:[protein-PII] uridylyltransferase n=1 Tax=Enterovirga sp. TaxID=2026350 RepID=UPI00262B3E43|nr:[protein-PII] uridylyltransferase [Enterovirga sp.]MDB5591473.1 [protein-PII] uridylyltransferase [Enterovirga sp.]
MVGSELTRTPEPMPSAATTTREPEQRTLRARLVPDLEIQRSEGLAQAEKLLARSRDGLTCARSISATMDSLLETVHAAVLREQRALGHAGTADVLTVVATGGYGRGTMAPGSDVDLLFLLPKLRGPHSEAAVEAILYVLWDLKLKLGHATRTIDECVREARNDMTVRTALLEARYVAGDRSRFERLQKRFARDVVKGSASLFVDAKLKERDDRVSRAGKSRYLVEPNVKDGKGGLRDLNTLLWIAKYVYGVDTPAELVKAGLFTTEEAELFDRCEEFLWRVRCHLHFATGRAEERLTFDMQRIVAQRLGFEARSGLSGVERFMKAYFSVAKQVGDLTAIVCAELESRHAKRRPVLDRVLGSFRRRGRVDAPDFRNDNDRITVRSDDVFARDPVNLIRLFWLADRHNLPVHPDASRLASRSLGLIGPTLRKSEDANRLFMDILTSRNAPEVVLRRMNEIGVLGRFVPDFGRVVAMMQFNMYHHYTVDEHLLRSIGVLAEIDARRVQSEHPLANEIVQTIRHRRALYVAMFLHDIAKGRVEDHSVAGAAIARKLGRRLGLDAAEIDTASWLVEHHLLMSTTAQGRDLSDPKTVSSFAEVVQTIERLKLLLVLTIADIKAVGPGVWTGWKGELLRTLYFETELWLTGGQSERLRPDRVATTQQRLREALADWTDEEFARYAARLYPAYWMKTVPERQRAHAVFVRDMEDSGRTVATRVETDAFRAVTEITVASPDHPRLLAIITGACAAAGGNIVDAQIFTSADGLALDTISLSRGFDRDEDEIRRAERIAVAIERALRSEIRIGDLVAGRRPSMPVPKAFEVPAEVVIDNDLSSRQTVIEVTGLDRPGLLYDLTTALGRLNLNIASAHVATFGEKAADVFYVSDLVGTKVTHPSRQAAIRRCLLAVLDGRP